MKRQGRLCGEEPSLGVLATSYGRRASLKNETNADLAAEMRRRGLDYAVHMMYVCIVGREADHVP
jgi:hypothetical protein